MLLRSASYSTISEQNLTANTIEYYNLTKFGQDWTEKKKYYMPKSGKDPY